VLVDDVAGVTFPLLLTGLAALAAVDALVLPIVSDPALAVNLRVISCTLLDGLI
tara:strand:+ start:678 stop:839 length:162 start_codon:yes stop_codon:yes gene_type:complete